MMFKVHSLFACGLLAGALAAPLPASAQTGNSQRPPDAPGPTVPGPRPGENLSDQLRRNDGVIPPAQNLDPEIRKTPTDTGTTPVIPPPGTPGGDNSLQPK
ncbi:hypothetical protein GCM10007301_20440 [Azorhizobium oxalatiphilum]|uniref:Lipoprotein n=1 Tax=Azorhizobium oxalatiphilum TaxID=980631 RepID=A0A917BZC5_9HYPH|nr:hypothetical protein [Azorhizobium oxalatiphilum]GGF60602.1 hypothetical protein GCM10007301_20440 [Azorhizobium oxalatiphilum]